MENLQDKVALFSQPAGLGDHIFAMGVCHHFIEQGYKIVYPVKPMYVPGNNIAYPYINFIPDNAVDPKLLQIRQDMVKDGMRILPVRFSDSILKQPSKYWMKTKYDLYGLDYTKWKDSADYVRNQEKEKELATLLGVYEGDSYNLINVKFRSDFAGTADIKVDNGIKNVEIKVLPGFSLFDYSWLIENATTIHVANSAIFYLLELLDLKASEIHLYERAPDEKGFPYVDYLFSKKYILHTS